MTAVELGIQVPTALAASALFTLGGYPAVGWASSAVCLAAGGLALRLPEAPRPRDDDGSLGGTLRRGLVQAVRRPGLRLTVAAVALIGGLDAVEEYFPVLASGWGFGVEAVPFAVLSLSLAGAAGAWLAGRAARPPGRALAGMLGAGGLGLLAAGLWARPAALVLAATFYGLYLGVLVVAEVRLQDRIPSTARATITSVAGLGIDVASLLVFAAWAVGGPAAVAVLVLAVVPVAAAGLRLPARVSGPNRGARGTTAAGGRGPAGRS